MTGAPLRGRRVMTTHPGPSSRFGEALERSGATVWHVPTIEIVPPETWGEVDIALRDWTAYDWVVFTSGNALKAVRERLGALHLSDATPRPKIAVVGGPTAQLVKSVGWQVSVEPTVQSGEGLIAAIIERESLAGKQVLFPKGNRAREVVPESLRAAGAEVREVIVYRTVPAKIDGKTVRSRLRRGEVDAITFTSPSAAQSFVEALGQGIWHELPESVIVASIGPTTSEALRELGRKAVAEAAEPSSEALAKAVAAAFDRM